MTNIHQSNGQTFVRSESKGSQVKLSHLNSRQQICSLSNDSTQVQTPQEFPRQQCHRSVTATKYLVITGVCVIVMIMLITKEVGDTFHSTYRELERRLETSTTASSAERLHLDDGYAFDGMNSDFAQQFYRRYLDGDDTEAITDTSDLGEVVSYVSAEIGLDFAKLPAMLQQAVVWDMGYVAAANLGYVKIYTKCGSRMSELQISRSAHKEAGCTEQTCSSSNGKLFHQSLHCCGYHLGNISLCAAANDIAPVHGTMWAEGGTDDVVPVSEIQRHEWTDEGVNFTMMAIHLSNDPNSGSKCVAPSMTIPCVIYDPDELKSPWCSPERGTIVSQWLELEKASVSTSSGRHDAALPIAIVIAVILLLVLAAFILFRIKTCRNFIIQKCSSLCGRRSDEIPMLDDIDVMVEAPDPSFMEKDKKLQPASKWMLWTPLKKIQAKKRLLFGGNHEDLDVQSISKDSNDVDRNTFRYSSGAITAAPTSFASNVPCTPQTLPRYTNLANSPASSTPSSAAMASLLVESQNDLAVATRRVAFADVRLVRQISASAYREVWMGRMSSGIVAIKRLARDKCSLLDEVETFVAETKLMASFSHPNVLHLSGVAWNTLEDMFLIMEFMVRGDLQYVLQHQEDGFKTDRTSNEFSWASHKAKIARDISCGLRYLHCLNPTVVHRDLNSKNVLIGNQYEAKLNDFRASRMRHSEKAMTSGIDTAFWTAPEVLSGYKYSEKADVYSFGVVLAELDTGELPFYDARTPDGDKMEAIHILSQVVEGILQPSFTLDCPRHVRKLALVCLNPNPECRPSAKKVLDELNRLLDLSSSSITLI